MSKTIVNLPKSEAPTVIQVSDVWKKFRLYHEKSHSLKETFLKRKKSSYEEFWALKGVSFQVGKKETFGIIGENGSGKSTLLKLLTRILRPNQGEIGVDGKVSALLELGAGFHPELTGRENIYLNGSILGFSNREIDKKLDEIISFAELERFIDIPVKNYSSGMYVRLGFAIAINVDPDILLIDEVLAVGDELFQRKCTDKIFEFKLKGKTIVIVSHNLGAIRNLCDRAIWIHEGEIKAEGETKQVIETYLKCINEQEQAHRAAGNQITPEYGSRHGSYEVEVTDVEFLDAQGAKRKDFRTGDKFIARLNYKCHQEIAKPVFGIAIFTLNGVEITGPNTKIDNLSIDHITGEGYIDYVIENLPLLPGTYLLSAAIYDYNCLHAYDHQDKMHMFKVVPGEKQVPSGTIHLPSNWVHGKA